MNLGPHTDFIVAAYGITLLVVTVLIAWIAFDYRAQRRQVSQLESQGISRRSAQAKTPIKTSA